MKTSAANELVTIKSFPNEIEAGLAKGYLLNAGISSFIFKDDCGGARPHMQLTLGVELKTRQVDFERASDILESIGTANRNQEELKPGENKVALISLFSWLTICTGCGFLMLSMSLGKIQLVIGIILIIIGIILGISSRNIKNKIKKK